MKEDSTDDPDPTLSLEIDDLLGQAYYKYSRDDEHHPESWQVLKALFERNIEGKHVSFHRHVITPEEREEIEKDKQLPYYSTAFIQGAPSLKCINMLNSIRNPRCSDLADFHIYKWISNKPNVIADIAEGDLASEIDL